MKKIACIQHLAEEGPGALADWALRRDVAIELFRGDLGQLPTHEDYDAYVSVVLRITRSLVGVMVEVRGDTTESMKTGDVYAPYLPPYLPKRDM